MLTIGTVKITATHDVSMHLSVKVSAVHRRLSASSPCGIFHWVEGIGFLVLIINAQSTLVPLHRPRRSRLGVVLQYRCAARAPGSTHTEVRP